MRDDVSVSCTRRLLVVSGAALAVGLTACATALAPEVRQALAPTGTLRVAVYPGSPTSMVRSPDGEMRGLSVEIGRELARRIGVPVELVVLQRVAEVLEALKSGRADFAITNATPARAQDVDFVRPSLVSLELGYLSLPGSPVQALDDVDRAGVRIGVSQGSTTHATLPRELKLARVVPAPSLQAAGQMLQRREIDAFATNKAILYELGDSLPRARVLDGRWGLEHVAIAVPKGRGTAAIEYLSRFAESVRSDGLVRTASARAGLRGLAE